MSVKTDVIILCSACLTASSSALASHSHCASAGCEHIAHSGSIFLIGVERAGGQGPRRARLRCFLINIIVGRK